MTSPTRDHASDTRAQQSAGLHPLETAELYADIAAKSAALLARFMARQDAS